MLNLDGTKVTMDIINPRVVMVDQCPKLSQLNVRNFRPFTRDDEIEEADMEVGNWFTCQGQNFKVNSFQGFKVNSLQN